MSFQDLKEELGAALTPKEVAKLFGVDPRTVKKYADILGGVEVVPGRLRFFENQIRRFIHANGNLATRCSEVARRREDARQDRCLEMVWEWSKGTQQRSPLGSGDKKNSRSRTDEHGIADCFRLGD